MGRKNFLLILLFFFWFTCGYGQRLFTGIVVDSAKLTNIPDVHIMIKNAGKLTTSLPDGSFMINANVYDTLVFTAIGYLPSEIPLMFAEDAMFVMLREDKILLDEVVIKSKRLYPNKIEDRTRTAPKTLSTMQGIFSPFDYFWSVEREKRKLTRIVEENNRTQTFRIVITDPDVKSIMIREYEITDEAYYNLIVRFNQEQSHVHYFTDPDAIMESLHGFFEKELKGGQ